MFFRNSLLQMHHKNWLTEVTRYRSSRPEVFCNKGVLRNFSKFTGKRLCQSLFLSFFFFIMCFPVLTEHLCWLLLKIFERKLHIRLQLLFKFLFTWFLNFAMNTAFLLSRIQGVFWTVQKLLTKTFRKKILREFPLRIVSEAQESCAASFLFIID